LYFKEKKDLKNITLIALFLFLVACGGSSSDDSVKEDTPITYTALPTTLNVDEGEQVSLSLSTSGNGANQLTFDWIVGDGSISFTGQGTDSISFTAPEVDVLESIRVSVDLRDTTRTVIGFVEQDISINVANVETLQDNINRGSDANLPLVNALDFSEILDGSTWIQERVEFSDSLDNENNTITIAVNLHNILYMESVDISREEITLSACGLTNSEVLNINEFVSDVDCGTEESVLNIYQSDNVFKLERMCGNTVAVASTFTKKSDERVTSFGELNVKFETTAELASTSNVCGIVATSEVKLFDSNDILVETRVFSQYEGNPFELNFQVDELPRFSSATFTSFDDNTAIISSESLPDINNISNVRFGSISFDFDNTQTNIEAEFDLDIVLPSSGVEEVEGTFTLRFE